MLSPDVSSPVAVRAALRVRATVSVTPVPRRSAAAVTVPAVLPDADSAVLVLCRPASLGRGRPCAARRFAEDVGDRKYSLLYLERAGCGIGREGR